MHCWPFTEVRWYGETGIGLMPYGDTILVHKFVVMNSRPAITNRGFEF
jgi:hypothetical protein